MATETSSTGRTSDKFMLRLPDGMREQISDAAKAAGRTMNAEIVQRLEQTFQASGAGVSADGLGHAGQELQAWANKRGLTAAQALEALLLARDSPDSAVLLVLNVHPGATVADMTRAVVAAKELAPPDAPVLMTRV